MTTVPNGVRPMRGDALLVVDMQIDFLPDGALAVDEGDALVPLLNRYLSLFHHCGLPVFATRDWHTPDHCSFLAQGGPWPVHCVAGTRGAEFAPGLKLPPTTRIISKATRQDRDAYSSFADTGLAEQLRADGVDRIFIGGLATDYCVLNTVLDALKLGLKTHVLADAIRAVNVRADDGARALQTMRESGAQLTRLSDFKAAA